VRVLVLTVSDRASQGVYEDLSGPAVERVLRELVPGIDVQRRVVPDDIARISEALSAGPDVDAIITTGGTGIGPRDVTPEATVACCDRLVPGIAEMLRAESGRQTPHAAFSRGVAGVKGRTLIVNVPGSVRAAEFCARLIAPMLEHACAMLRGDGH